MNIIRSLALAAVLAVPTAALAQQPVRIPPGAQLDTTFVRSRTDSLAILAAHGGQSVRGRR